MFLEKLKKNAYLKDVTIICCDFETFLINDTHYVCCVSFFGKNISYVKSLNKIDSSTAPQDSYQLINDFIFELTKLNSCQV